MLLVSLVRMEFLFLATFLEVLNEDDVVLASGDLAICEQKLPRIQRRRS